MIPPNSIDSPFGGNGNGTSTTAEAAPASSATSLVPVRPGLPVEYGPEWMEGGPLWAGGEAASQGISPVEFLHSLRRRWGLALGLSLGIGLAAALLVYLLVPVTYEAAALLQVKSTEASFLDAGRNTPKPTQSEMDAFRQNQAVLLKSDQVLNRAKQNPELSETSIMQREKDKLRFLKEEIVVTYPARSEIMVVSMKGDRPAELVKIVKAVVVAYLEEIVQADRNRLVEQLGAARDARDQKQDLLRRARDQLHTIGTKLGAMELNQVRLEQQLLMDELGRTARQLQDVGTRADEAELRWRLLKAQLDSGSRTVPAHLVEEALRNDRQYQELNQLVLGLEHRYQQVRSTTVGENAAVRRMADQLQNAYDQRNTYRRNVAAQLRKSMAEGSGREELRQLQLEALAYREQQAMLKRKYDEIDEKIKNRNLNTSEFEAQRDLVVQFEEATRKLNAQIEIWDLERKRPDRVEWLGKMVNVPETPDYVFKFVLTIGAGVIGFAVTGLGVGWIEFLKRRVNTEQDVSKRLGVALVGTLPPLTRRGVGQFLNRIGDDELETILSDSIDAIRTSLIHGMAGNGKRVILVTSAGDDEGKTTVASQLAVSLARCGRRTLLVDADLRQPVLHEMFELPLERGLGEVLRGEIELEDAARPTQVEGLHLMSGGQSNYASLQALENDSVGRLFDRMRSQFDFVVIDSAPVLAFADSLLIGQYSDGAILAVRIDVSQRPKIEEAVLRLRTVGINLFGAVVNGANPPASRRGSARILAAN